MAAMNIDFEGKSYVLDIEDITLSQAATIQTKYGFTLLGLNDALDAGDANAFRILYWLMVVQNGDPNANLDLLDFKIVKFGRALGAAESGNADAEAGESTPK